MVPGGPSRSSRLASSARDRGRPDPPRREPPSMLIAVGSWRRGASARFSPASLSRQSHPISHPLTHVNPTLPRVRLIPSLTASIHNIRAPYSYLVPSTIASSAVPLRNCRRSLRRFWLNQAPTSRTGRFRSHQSNINSGRRRPTVRICYSSPLSTIAFRASVAPPTNHPSTRICNSASYNTLRNPQDFSEPQHYNSHGLIHIPHRAFEASHGRLRQGTAGAGSMRLLLTNHLPALAHV